MRLKKFLGLAAAMAVTFSLAACGGSSQESAQTGTDSAQSGESTGSSGTGELNVVIWDGNQEPGIKQILSEFTEASGIKTNLQVVNWDEYWTLLEAGGQGGTMPDVFWMHSNEAERYMSNDMLLDVTDLAAKSDKIDFTNYPADIVELYTHDGKNYAIPKDIDTIALWYNKTMFDEAGIAYPDDTWTWDTFADTAIELTKEDGSQFGTAIRTTNNQDGYYNMIYSYGGEVITEDKTASGYDNPKTIEGMQVIQKLLDASAMPSLEVMSESQPDALFTSGKVAMLPLGSWFIPAMRNNEYSFKNADIAVLPKGPEGRASIYNGLGWAASANGSNTEGAWQLLEYLGSKEAQERQAELGVTMSAYEGTSETWVNSVPEFNMKAYLDTADRLVIRPYSRSTVTWENGTNEVFKAAWSGTETVEESCKKAAAQMNEIIAAE